jgi:hypothetical protein
MSSTAFTVPILSGKLESWKKFNEEINGPRRSEFDAQQKRFGISCQMVWLQHSPQGDFVVVYQEGKDLDKAMGKIGASKDPFDKWFTEQVSEIHGIDFSNLPQRSLSELMLNHCA